MLKAKQNYFLAIANYHQGVVAKDKGLYGENVARMKVLFLLVLKELFAGRKAGPKSKQS